MVKLVMASIPGGEVTVERLLRELPSVDSLLKSEEGARWLREYPRTLVVNVIRDTLNFIRDEIRKGALTENLWSTLQGAIEKGLKKASQPSLRPVINATGIVIHTNLGRSILGSRVLANILKIAESYSNLEYDLSEGRRGKRFIHVVKLLKGISGAEDAFVVNNNAAAVFITLNSLAAGKEVIVSRGELVEIGGSFRMPDVMKMSGAILKEVGTTNKTHLYDYERAINENTALIMKVHRSNFRLSGFVEEVSAEELVRLGRTHNIPVVFDLGSGCLIDLKKYGLADEPTVQEVLKTGVDIVTFSGDKLLGGPQAGIILGKKEYIERLRKSPLARVVRVDKFTLSGLEATLYEYLDEDNAIRMIPTLRMLLEEPERIKKRAELIAKKLQKIEGWVKASAITTKTDGEIKALISVREEYSQAGGGALPEVSLRTYCVAIKPVKVSCNTLLERLRWAQTPVIARLREDMLLLDARTIQDHEIGLLVEVLAGAL